LSWTQNIGLFKLYLFYNQCRTTPAHTLYVNIFCRAQSYISYSKSEAESEDNAVDLSHIKCSGGEKSLSQCKLEEKYHPSESCPSTDRVLVKCLNSAVTSTSGKYEEIL